MDYKVDDDFLDKVDSLIDSVMELSQASDAINSMGIALVNLKKLEQVRENATELCDERWKTVSPTTKKERMMKVEKKVRRTPKKAPVIVTMILIPYILIRTAMDLAMWLTDAIAEGFQVLGPRFQGMVIGFFGAVAMFIFALNLAVWG